MGALILRIQTIQQDLYSLAALRDTLLSKFISGELRVGGAGRYMRGAL